MMERVGPLAGEWIFVVCVMAAGLFVNKAFAPHTKLIVSPTDEELSYPMMPQTVPEPLLIVVSFALPLAAVCAVCEMVFKDRRDLHVSALMLSQACAFGVLITAVAKKQAGRPRPCFFDMCQWSNTTASGVPGCTASAAWEWEARQSFPSGHASFGFSGLGYLTLFLLEKAWALSVARRLPQSLPFSAAQLAALMPVCLAMVIAITRVVDFWHNYDDILAGSVLGAACATQAFWQRGRYTAAWFEERSRSGGE
eukprot:CAMPEP_0206243356 /NCGR_PEP_ID=MMETSP0047_2-20121206/17565_1 /ASSEMBLY_ACC=CAM_ASM_000192 /TAXON_ID=195065 /ORGANISM="Chroomonas mesostigmatica_cf, Strain CCMP1168" /LENGTH=252 /DNA_ID=CAMNT_0053668473 /DNA_START=411 /DNA_END=1166 /DNA_ORIENTATION=+